MRLLISHPGTIKANPDSAQWPVRQRALEDGKTVYVAVPRLAEPEPFFALEFALATAAGLIGPHTTCVTTVHELQVYPAGAIPLTGHDVPVDFIFTPERGIDCRPGHGSRPAAAGICWEDLTEEKIAAIPLLPH
jgi:5-formyltetrahydrofolate cyclo-ligase